VKLISRSLDPLESWKIWKRWPLKSRGSSRFGKHLKWPLIVGLVGLTSNGSVLGRLLSTMR
jgi:hypothetical protein